MLLNRLAKSIINIKWRQVLIKKCYKKLLGQLRLNDSMATHGFVYKLLVFFIPVFFITSSLIKKGVIKDNQE